MAKMKCKNCTNPTGFYVTAHVTQEWLVDADGDWIRTINECSEVTHGPDENDLWTCADCHEEADECPND